MKMNMRCLLVGAAGALATAAGCSEPSGPVGGLVRLAAWVPDSAAVVSGGCCTGFAQASRAVVADPDTWAAVWAQFSGNVEPKPSLPAVDFNSDVVIVAALGPRPTGGYGIRVDSVAVRGGTVVYLTTVAPGPRCFTTQMVTSPAQLVRVPRPPQPITFQERSVETACQ